jgi:hypothetical protein
VRFFDTLDARLAPRLSRRPEPLLPIVLALFLAATLVHAQRYAVLSQAAAAPAPRPPVEAGPPLAQPSPQVAPEQPQAVLPGTTLVVGPRAGQRLERYAAGRRAALARRASAMPDALGAAIVSLEAYASPDAAAALVAAHELDVVAVRYRVQVEGAVHQRVAAAGELVATLLPVLRTQAEAARTEAEELQELIDTAQDPAFNATFTRDRDRLIALADAISDRGCVCIYALEVTAPLRTLATVVADPVVRLVDVAPPGADLADTTFLALLPEERARAGAGRP